MIRKKTGKPVIKYGAGGRSSVSGHIATVFGCTGFLGRYLVSKLGKQGTQVVVPYRDEDEKRFLKVMGDLGQIVPWEFDVRNKDAIVAAVRHSDIVYNLIGRDYETKNFSFDDINIDCAARLAQISTNEGVSRFIHVSALGANENSTSKFYRTKALGEIEVKKAFPEATIVRPAKIFGREDRFLNRLAAGRGYEFLIEHGKAKVYPVHVSDVALALETMLKAEHTIRETYELVGNKEYTYEQIYDLIGHITRKRVLRVNVPKPIAVGYAQLLGFLPWPTISPDEIERMTIDEKLTPGVRTFKDLHIEPQSLETTALATLRLYRSNVWFDASPDDPVVKNNPHLHHAGR